MYIFTSVCALYVHLHVYVFLSFPLLVFLLSYVSPSLCPSLFLSVHGTWRLWSCDISPYTAGSVWGSFGVAEEPCYTCSWTHRQGAASLTFQSPVCFVMCSFFPLFRHHSASFCPCTIPSSLFLSPLLVSMLIFIFPCSLCLPSLAFLLMLYPRSGNFCCKKFSLITFNDKNEANGNIFFNE